MALYIRVIPAKGDFALTLPYTAGDSLQVIAREHGISVAPAFRDRIELVLHRKRRIAPADLRALYDRAGRARPADDVDLARVLNAGPTVGAWDGERLIGFARALSDGQLVAYIEEVLIDKQYRELGLGQALIATLLAELAGVAVVNHRGSAGTVTVYERRRPR
jgi:GNAT superfamily N-acetyltransferase